MTIRTHFREMCFGLGVGCDESVLEDLVNRYNEPHRSYHTVEHIDACLALFDGIGHSHAERPAEVMATLLYHDAIYDPTRSGGNEEDSALLARADLTRAGVGWEVTSRVEWMVRATAHRLHLLGLHDEPLDPDGQLVVDIDLSILGADESTFDAYEVAIRQEYAFVPEEAFRRARQAILEYFAARPRLFMTPVLHERFEAQAQTNIARSLARLWR